MAVYHLKVSIGSRAGGQSAGAKADYIEREGNYEKDREELEHKEHGNMPEWAKDDPGAYWEAADEHERANGRLYREIQFALPKELNEEQRRELASSFAASVTEGERLPYTLAIHRGGPNGENPHAHLMFSERPNDGIERGKEQWFKRYNAKSPEKGGTQKSRAAMPQAWLEDTRKAWAREANAALERAGRGERIDHRSLAERRDVAERSGDLQQAAELSREPNVHLGPERYRAMRGGESATVQRAGRVDQVNAADRGERATDNRRVERLGRATAGIEARLKETYDRLRAELDKRIGEARQAIRRGSRAAERASRTLGKAGATVGRVGQRGRERVHRLAGNHDLHQRGTPEDGGAHHEIDRRLRRTTKLVQSVSRRLHLSGERFDRARSLIHREAEQKRQSTDWRRVDGRIENLIQGRARSRGGWDFSR